MWEMLQEFPIYWAVLIGTVLDHSGLPLFLLLAVATAAKTGAGIGLLALAGLAGAFAGDMILYVVGRSVGRRTLLSGHVSRFFGRMPETLLAHVKANPIRSLVLYRYIPAAGKYAPLASGAMGLSWPRAALLCACGTALYVVVFTLVGWVVQVWVLEWLISSRGVWGPCAAGGAIIIVIVLVRRARGPKDPCTTPGAPRPPSPFRKFP